MPDNITTLIGRIDLLTRWLAAWAGRGPTLDGRGSPGLGSLARQEAGIEKLQVRTTAQAFPIGSTQMVTADTRRVMLWVTLTAGLGGSFFPEGLSRGAGVQLLPNLGAMLFLTVKDHYVLPTLSWYVRLDNVSDYYIIELYRS